MKHEIFKDPGLTDSQGTPCQFKYLPTAWGGHIVYLETKFDKDYACFDAGAYKRFLSWLVGK